MIEHEIRTAVTVVRGYLRWLGGERDRLLEPEHGPTCARRAARSSASARCCDNLLELARSGEALPSARKPCGCTTCSSWRRAPRARSSPTAA